MSYFGLTVPKNFGVSEICFDVDQENITKTLDFFKKNWRFAKCGGGHHESFGFGVSQKIGFV